MAIVYATKNGNWSDPTVWNTGTLPTTADDVRSNTFTVTVDVNELTVTPEDTETEILFSYQPGKIVITKNGDPFTAFTATDGTSVVLDVAANGTDEYLLRNSEWEVLSVSNKSETSPTVTAGGKIILGSGITLKVTTTTNGIVGAVSDAIFVDFISPAPAVANIVGDIRTLGVVRSVTVRNSSSGILNITGNSSQVGHDGGGSSSSITNTSSGTVNITGNNFAGGNCNIASNSGTGTINIIGNITASNIVAVFNTSSGTINISNSVLSGACVSNTSTGIVNITSLLITGASGSTNVTNSGVGTINIQADLVGGSTAGGYAIQNSSSGTINHSGTVSASSASPAVGPGSVSQVTLLTGPFIGHPNGTQANIAAAWRWNTSNPATYIEVYSSDLLEGTPRTLYTADFVGGNPDTSDVRLGTTFGPVGELTGTMAVPDPIAVAAQTPVDDTFGVAATSAEDLWSYPLESMTTPGSIGSRLRHVLTTQLLGKYLEAYGAYGPGDEPPTP